MGYMKNCVLREVTQEDIRKVADTFHNCKTSEGYEDEAGYCSSARLKQIKQHGYVLTLGRLSALLKRKMMANDLWTKWNVLRLNSKTNLNKVVNWKRRLKRT